MFHFGSRQHSIQCFFHADVCVCECLHVQSQVGVGDSPVHGEGLVIVQSSCRTWPGGMASCVRLCSPDQTSRHTWQSRSCASRSDSQTRWPSESRTRPFGLPFVPQQHVVVTQGAKDSTLDLAIVNASGNPQEDGNRKQCRRVSCPLVCSTKEATHW